MKPDIIGCSQIRSQLWPVSADWQNLLDRVRLHRNILVGAKSIQWGNSAQKGAFIHRPSTSRFILDREISVMKSNLLAFALLAPLTSLR